MNAGVVELDALADTDGAGTQHDHGGLIPVFADKLQSFVLAAGLFGVIGGIEVRSVGGKLAGAGIHHLEGGFPLELHFAAGQPGNGGIRIPQLLATSVQLFGELAFSQFPLVVQEVHQFGEEPAVDHGFLVHLLHGHAPL